MRLLVLAALCACAKGVDGPGTCLALPATERDGLATDGDALYWLEQVRTYNYDGELRGYNQLVRMDVDTRETTVLVDHAVAPIVFLQGKPVVRRSLSPHENTALVMVEDGGRIDVLAPPTYDVLDIEPVDTHTLAFIANGNGKRAIYTLSTEHPRPKYLIDADDVLATYDHHVLAGVDDKVVSIDLATGDRATFPLKPHTTPQGKYALAVKDNGVVAHDVPGDKDLKVVTERGVWHLVHQLDSTLVRAAPQIDVSRAFLVTSGAATPLPNIEGGATIGNAVRVRGKLWAIIAHNTPNYVADFGESITEADVCSLPETGSVKFPTRSVPARYLDKQDAVFRIAREIDHKATIQILDDLGAPTTVHIEVPDKRGDLDALRARARALHPRVTSLLGDRDAQTELELADHRSAYVRWSRERLRATVTAGMGDAQLYDPADYDVEVRDLVDTADGEHVHCKGTLANLRDKPLAQVEVRCVAGDRDRVIRVPDLAASATFAFDETFDGESNDVAGLSVYAGTEPLFARDVDADTHTRALLDMALAAYGDAQLALVEHKSAAVTLLGPEGFDKQPLEQRERAANAAYERYAGLGKELVLTIQVRLSNVTYTFDGVSLTEN